MAKRLFLVDVDLGQNQLLNGVVQVLSAAPSTPVEGQFYYNSTLKQLLVYDGAAWGIKATDAALFGGNNPAYYRARANHTGTQLAATISDFDTQVRTSRLDQMATPTANVAMGTNKLTGLGDGSADTDAATVGQVNGAAQQAASGLDPKDAVLAATTADITLSAAQTIDGVSLVAGDRVLVKNQAIASANGIYEVKAAAWARTPDASAGTLTHGALVLSTGGTVNAATQWYLNSADPITVGTTALTWLQFGAGVNYGAGDGITLTGSTFSADPKVGGHITVDAGGIDVAATVAKVYAADVGDAASTSITVTHSLGTQDVIVSLREKATPYAVVYCEVKANSTSQVTLGFNTAPTSAQYRCTVMGAS